MNEFEKDVIAEVCSDIRTTLDSLLKKWGASIDKQDIPVLTDVPTYHDGIDNIMQSIDALLCKCFFYILNFLYAFIVSLFLP